MFKFKDVRAHCYCASLERMLFIRHALPRHVFQARAPSRNSTKYWADDLCVNLVCEYFCWTLVDPHFFRQITSFSDSFRYTKKTKKTCTWEVSIISHYTIHIRSNLYVDTGVRDLGAAFLRLILPDLTTYVAKIYQIGLYIAGLNTYNLDMILQLKYTPIVMNSNPARTSSGDWKS